MLLTLDLACVVPVNTLSPYAVPVNTLSPYAVPVNTLSPYAVPVNTLSPDCFLCNIFLLKTISPTFTVSNNGNNGNNGTHIVRFMSYDSMNDI
jgi:hypothetical protein